MIKNRMFLILVLLIPIFALFGTVLQSQHRLHLGQTVVLPIVAYDPRDLLAGHYLVYQINYGVENICSNATAYQQRYICLDNHTRSLNKPENCKLFIRGRCNFNRFVAGIERFYLPENKISQLDPKIRNKTASVVITVMPDGQAQVKDLLVNGHSWKDLEK